MGIKNIKDLVDFLSLFPSNKRIESFTIKFEDPNKEIDRMVKVLEYLGEI